MTKANFFISGIAMLMALLMTSGLYAQGGIDFDDDVDDETQPDAPVSMYIYAGLTTGMALGYYFLKNKQINS
jgi:hypothetical protein